MGLYAVTFDCPQSGKRHPVVGTVVGGLVIDGGPDHAGTAAELWPRGDYPPSVAEVLRDNVWCDLVGDYVSMSDPARVALAPRSAWTR